MARQTLTEGSKHAIATAQAKAKGFKDFSPGTPGATARERVAQGLEKSAKIVPGSARMKEAAKRKLRGK